MKKVRMKNVTSSEKRGRRVKILIRKILIFMGIISIWLFTACGNNLAEEEEISVQHTSFEATILDIQDNYFLVEPTEDNQSNFGTGYGYQYGSTEGTIEININGKWWVYATEVAKEKMMGAR